MSQTSQDLIEAVKVVIKELNSQDRFIVSYHVVEALRPVMPEAEELCQEIENEFRRARSERAS